MRVNDLYPAISGEGVHAGVPVAIIRLQGCNLSCKYCDTKEAWNGSTGKEVDPIELVEKNVWPRWALITGGEPLMQAEDVCKMVDALQQKGVLVEIETNGSFSPPDWWKRVDCWSADVKCPSSGMAGRSAKDWLGTREQDQVKFVVADEEDLSFVLRTVPYGFRATPTILISPTYPWSQEWLQRCAAFCMNQGFRLSLQLHKIIYGERRGV